MLNSAIIILFKINISRDIVKTDTTFIGSIAKLGYVGYSLVCLGNTCIRKYLIFAAMSGDSCG